MNVLSRNPRNSTARALAWVATCAALTTLTTLAAPVALADEALPTAREVIDRFVEVTGAADVFGRHESMQTSGTFALPAQGMEGKLMIQAKAPNLMLLRIELAGFGEVLQGYDGTVGWAMDPASGPSLAEGDALAQLKDQANFYSTLYRDEDLQSLTLVGKEEFAGSDAYRITAVSVNGAETTLFFSVESGLLVGTDSVQHTPMGEISVRSLVSDYKEFEGALVPTRTEQTMMGMQQVITIDAVSFEPIDEAAFALPEAVAGLVEVEAH